MSESEGEDGAISDMSEDEADAEEPTKGEPSKKTPPATSSVTSEAPSHDDDEIRSMASTQDSTTDEAPSLMPSKPRVYSSRIVNVRNLFYLDNFS